MRHAAVMLAMLASACESRLERDLADLKERRISEDAITFRATAVEMYPRVKHDPRGLRIVAEAYFLTSAYEQTAEVLEELVATGTATVAEHVWLISVQHPSRVDETTYRRNMRWLKGIVHVTPSCENWRRLVYWTAGRDEAAAALDGALRSQCRHESLRADWYAARARTSRAQPGDACDAVVNGVSAMVDRCLASEIRDWRYGVATAYLATDAASVLRPLLAVDDLTAATLRVYAELPNVTIHEKCSAWKRAIAIARRKDDDAAAEMTGIWARTRGCML